MGTSQQRQAMGKMSKANREACLVGYDVKPVAAGGHLLVHGLEKVAADDVVHVFVPPLVRSCARGINYRVSN